ncbi:MAG: ABC transporter ATP-binding protein [Actinomycetota bacterium]
MSVLEAQSISKHFGGIRALDGVSISVEAGTITSLIGPNGAGKTTLFDCLTGIREPEEGRVFLDGVDVTHLETHERARRGMGRTFQRLEVFSGLTVRENLQVAAESARRRIALRDIFELRHRADPVVLEEVDATLDELDIAWAARRQAGDLPTGVLRIVELGRALCARPRVMLLDELASGLDEQETESLGRALRRLAESGIGILLIEHDLALVLALSSRIHVLDFGRIIACGTPEDIVANPTVRAAYLGAESPAPGECSAGVVGKVGS